MSLLFSSVCSRIEIQASIRQWCKSYLLGQGKIGNVVVTRKLWNYMHQLHTDSTVCLQNFLFSLELNASIIFSTFTILITRLFKKSLFVYDL